MPFTVVRVSLARVTVSVEELTRLQRTRSGTSGVAK